MVVMLRANRGGEVAIAQRIAIKMLSLGANEGNTVVRVIISSAW